MLCYNLEATSDIFMTVKGKKGAEFKNANIPDFRVSVFIFQYTYLFFYKRVSICTIILCLPDKKKKKTTSAFFIAEAHGKKYTLGGI